jgi:hypothetical protein
MAQQFTYDFTVDVPMIVSGLIVADDIEVEGRCFFTYTPGRKR